MTVQASKHEEGRALTLAIVDPFGKHSGHHYYVEGLARALSAHGARVLVRVTELTGIRGDEPYDVAVCFGQIYGAEPAWKRGLRYMRGMIKAMVSVRLKGAQVVSLHIFNFDIRDISTVWMARLLGLNVILTVHDLDSFGKQSHRFMRFLTISGGSAYVLHNRHCVAAFEKSEGKLSKPVRMIPHGHYIDSFACIPTRQDARQQLGLPEHPPIVLFFGNSRLEKGLDLLIEAAGKVRHSSDWRLVIAGKMKPHQRAYYSELIERHDRDKRIRMDAKHISDEEAVAYYRASNLVVAPYRAIYESGTMIMAMSLGRAVLVSDLPPLLDQIADGRAGMSFESNNVNSLAAALERALDRSGQLDAYGEVGLQNVRKQRDWMTIGGDFLALAKEITRR